MTTYSREEFMKILQDVYAGYTEDPGFQNLLVQAAAYCRQLHLMAMMNPLVPFEMRRSPGMAFQETVPDTLSGRSPLYPLNNFAEAMDRKLLLGEDADPGLFSNTNVGRSLAALAKCGTGRMLSVLGVEAVKRLHPDPDGGQL